MKKTKLAIDRGKWEDVLDSALRALIGAILFGGQIFDGYAPFALGWIAAAGPKRQGLSALFGGIIGAMAFLDFSHGLRAIAVMVLLYTANNAFCETTLYQKKLFLPIATAGLHLAVEFVYILQAGTDEAADCLLSIALCTLSAVCYRAAARGETGERRQGAALVIVVGV